jgi:ABC-2 type transport system permease protein
MNIKQTFAIRPYIIKGMLAKEFHQLLRDVRMRGIIFAAPLLMLIVFGYAVNTDVNNVKIAIFDEDRSVKSRGMIERITSSKHFALFENLDSINEGELLIQRNAVEAVIRIPSSFSASLDKGRPAQIQVLLDGTDSNRAVILFSYLVRISLDYSKELSASMAGRARLQVGEAVSISVTPPVLTEERAFFNETLESRVYFLPAILGLITALVIIMLTSMSIVKEREIGTIEQIIVSPIRPVEFIAGKVLPFGLVAIIDIVIITLAVILWFGVPFRGSMLLLLICSLFYTIACIGVGIFISTISSTQQQAMLSSFLFFLPAILLSGFIFPITSMPFSIQLVTYLNPMRYFMEIVRDIFLKGTGVLFIWKQALALLLLGVIFMMLSIRRFSRGFE